MILVDTSVWVDHLRHTDEELARILEAGEALAHPFVAGELSLGVLRQRDVIMSALRQMPQAAVADHEEVLTLVENHDLMGRGIGYIDAHLLASVRLTPGSFLWTRDRRLRTAAERLDVNWSKT